VAIVFFGSLIVLLMWGLTAGIFDSMVRTHVELDYGALKAFPAGYRSDPAPARGFTREELDRVFAATDGIRGAASAPRLVSFGLLRSAYGATGVEIRGVDPQREALVTRLPEALVEGRFLSNPGEAVLGVRVARALDVRLGERVVVLAQGASGTGSRGFVVVGVLGTGLPSLDERTVFVSLADAQALLDVDGATEVSLSLPRGVQPDPVATALGSELADHEVLPFAQGNPLITGIVQANTVEMVIWMVLLALLAGFGVANTVLFSVIERTREFGVMGALGMSARRLAVVVVTESVLVSMLGFAAAAVGGYFLIGYLARTGIALGPLGDAMGELGIPGRIYASAEGWYWAASFVVVVITGAVAAWYPARRAAKLEPVEAIRDV
jgi:ABC-type lipoprotein release transport system permease subunit